MIKIAIWVSGGMIQDVRSNSKEIEVEVIDVDNIKNGDVIKDEMPHNISFSEFIEKESKRFKKEYKYEIY